MQNIGDYDPPYSEGRYFTVLIPWSDTPTEWHPTDKSFCPLTRGCFKSEIAARLWASQFLAGQPYWLACIEYNNLGETFEQFP